jgi:hypothetical protein
LLVAVALAAAPERSYDDTSRSARLITELTAVRSTDLGTLENTVRYVQAMKINTCSSSFQRLAIDCLVQQTRKNCRGHSSKEERQTCRHYSDVIVVNALSEPFFVTTEERFQIMESHADFRAALRRRLDLRYGELATSFRLWDGYACDEADTACIGHAIDTYCMDHADTANVSWQHCAAALVWFTGVAGR